MAKKEVGKTTIKKTKYQRAQSAAGNYCKNNTPAAKERMEKAFETYKEDAMKKGKSATEVNQTLSRLRKCDFIGKSSTRKTKKSSKKK